ncbi:transposase [Providencia manganoxydans]
MAIVPQSFESDMSVSIITHQHGFAANPLFLWREKYQKKG